VHDCNELKALVHYLGETEAEQIAGAARSGFVGIPRQAYDVLAQATYGYPGRYSDPRNARDALQDLMERFPDV